MIGSQNSLTKKILDFFLIVIQDFKAVLNKFVAALDSIVRGYFLLSLTLKRWICRISDIH